MTTYTFTYRSHAQTLYQALRDDAFYATMESTVANGSSREAMLRYMDYSMIEAARHGVLRMSATDAQGASVWAKPLDGDAATRKHRCKTAFLEAHMGPASVATYAAIVDYMAQQARPLIDAAAWYLSILGVSPAAQGRGIGARLVGATLAETDRLGAPTYLETFTPLNIPFYQRLGYEACGAFREPTTGADYWLLYREAKTPG